MLSFKRVAVALVSLYSDRTLRQGSSVTRPCAPVLQSLQCSDTGWVPFPDAKKSECFSLPIFLPLSFPQGPLPLSGTEAGTVNLVTLLKYFSNLHWLDSEDSSG